MSDVKKAIDMVKQLCADGPIPGLNGVIVIAVRKDDSIDFAQAGNEGSTHELVSDWIQDKITELIGKRPEKLDSFEVKKPGDLD